MIEMINKVLLRGVVGYASVTVIGPQQTREIRAIIS